MSNTLAPPMFERRINCHFRGVTWSNVLFAQKNGNITLRTSITQGIQEILWKFQGNKVADWDELSGVTDYLQFKRRTYLVRETGDLTIFSLKSEDSGLYEGELIINGNIHTVKHDLSIIDPGSKSNIICKTIDDDNAILLCQAEGPHLSYSWSGPGLNTGFNGQIGPNVSRVENANSDYSCVVKNPVSEMTVYFKAADCFTSKEEKENKSGKTLVIILLTTTILALIVLGLAIAVFIYMKKRSSEGNEHVAHMQGKDDREENPEGGLMVTTLSLNSLENIAPTNNGRAGVLTSTWRPYGPLDSLMSEWKTEQTSSSPFKLCLPLL
ncbi:uncharacterized protein LOC134088102 [Sardina pilchardus]|uniref:uncharacterized protein LOC134088102 n=1 Tax=Sardina pilchardus TaxID=27697 RepID=UPI002E0D273E